VRAARAGKHLDEIQPLQSVSERASVLFVPFRQRQISEARMLTCEAPRGFAVARQVNDRKFSFHDEDAPSGPACRGKGWGQQSVAHLDRVDS